jgi:hypothetical protein
VYRSGLSPPGQQSSLKEDVLIRKLLGALILTGALTAVSVSAVFAHECIIQNRSAQGNAMAAEHSPKWGVLTLDDIFGFILPEVLSAPPLTPDQQAWAVQQAEDAGIPYSFVSRTDKTIGDGSRNPNLADGKGLDHLADLYGDQLAGIYFAALGT